AQLHASSPDEQTWISSDSTVAQVYPNGFVLGLKQGSAKIAVTRPGEPPAECQVTVTPSRQPLIDPTTLKQYPDERKFTVDGRKCYGSELNGQRNDDPAERKFTRANRVINPQPLNPKDDLEWEVESGAEIYDGAGVLMGTVAPTTEVAGRGKVPS